MEVAPLRFFHNSIATIIVIRLWLSSTCAVHSRSTCNWSNAPQRSLRNSPEKVPRLNGFEQRHDTKEGNRRVTVLSTPYAVLRTLCHCGEVSGRACLHAALSRIEFTDTRSRLFPVMTQRRSKFLCGAKGAPHCHIAMFARPANTKLHWNRMASTTRRLLHSPSLSVPSLSSPHTKRNTGKHMMLATEKRYQTSDKEHSL